MIHIIYTRHGETDWNKEKKIQGSKDIPLNAKGIEQANNLHELLKDRQIDIIFSSPLNRAKETANIIRGERPIDIIVDPLLKEQCYGDLEGKPMIDNPEYLLHKNSFFKRYPNGESYFDVYHRVATFFEKIKKDYDGKVSTILIVAHGGMSREINAYFKDMENDEFPKFIIHNCQLLEYDL